MKNLLQLSTIALFTAFLFLSCTGDKKTDNENRKNPGGASFNEADTSLTAIRSLIEEVQKHSDFNGDEKKQKQLDILHQLLGEMATRSKALSGIVSGQIDFEKDFLPRRIKFKEENRLMIAYKMFPTFFQMNRGSLDSLYDFSRNKPSLNVLRFYPIHDTRPNVHNRYSYAFIWADTTSREEVRVDKNFVIDIIDPCPPGDCDKVDL